MFDSILLWHHWLSNKSINFRKSNRSIDSAFISSIIDQLSSTSDFSPFLSSAAFFDSIIFVSTIFNLCQNRSQIFYWLHSSAQISLQQSQIFNLQLQKTDIFRFRRSFRLRLLKIDRSNFYSSFLFNRYEVKYRSVSVSFFDNSVFCNSVFDNNCFCQAQFACTFLSKTESQFELNFALLSLSIFFFFLL